MRRQYELHVAGNSSGTDAVGPVLSVTLLVISGSIPKRSPTMIPFPVPAEDEMQAVRCTSHPNLEYGALMKLWEEV